MNQKLETQPSFKWEIDKFTSNGILTTQYEREMNYWNMQLTWINLKDTLLSEGTNLKKLHT